MYRTTSGWCGGGASTNIGGIYVNTVAAGLGRVMVGQTSRGEGRSQRLSGPGGWALLHVAARPRPRAFHGVMQIANVVSCAGGGFLPEADGKVHSRELDGARGGLCFVRFRVADENRGDLVDNWERGTRTRRRCRPHMRKWRSTFFGREWRPDAN